MLMRMSWIPVVAVFCGCHAPEPKVRVDGSTWTASEYDETQRPRVIDVACLGQTVVRSEVKKTLIKHLGTADNSPLENRALTMCSLGVCATHLGDLEIARNALDSSLEIMDAIIYDPEKVKEVAALPGQERTKIFKGESHERAICNLYRGLVYLADGDYENARACFLRADMYKPARAGGEDTGNWLSLRFLAAYADFYCPTKMGLHGLIDVPEDLEINVFSSSDDTLIVVLTGLCPAKRHQHGGKLHGLTYSPVPSKVSAIEVYASVDEQYQTSEYATATETDDYPDRSADSERPIHLVSCDELREDAKRPLYRITKPSEDIYIQAASNGRREMDKLLAAKQQSKEFGQGVGDASEVIASVIMGIPFVNLAVYPLFIASAVSKDASAKADSTADLRSIHAPGYIYIATVDSSLEPYRLKVYSDNGALLGESVLQNSKQVTSRPIVYIVRVYQ